MGFFSDFLFLLFLIVNEQLRAERAENFNGHNLKLNMTVLGRCTNILKILVSRKHTFELYVWIDYAKVEIIFIFEIQHVSI